MLHYTTSHPPDSVTEELIQAIIEDTNQHLEQRLASIAQDFDRRIHETREYITRRTRERIQELITKNESLDLRRKKKQPVIPDWRVPGGEFSPDDPRRENA